MSFALCGDVVEFSGSSSASPGVIKARLDASGSGWLPRDGSSTASWLQVDLGSAHKLTALATRGSEVEAWWTTSYIVSYSTDAVAWSMYEENAALGERTFSGNTDGESIEKRDLRKPFVARYVRVEPKSWHERAALRVEWYGSPVSHLPEKGVLYALESRAACGTYAGARSGAVVLVSDGLAGAAELTFSRTSDANEWSATIGGSSLGVASSSTANGAAITATPSSQAKSSWVVRDAGRGWVRLVSLSSSGCVTVEGASPSVGSKLIQSTKPSVVKSESAQWRLRRVGAIRRRWDAAEALRRAASAAAIAEAERALVITGSTKIGIADGSYLLRQSSGTASSSTGGRLHLRSACWALDEATAWLQVDLGATQTLQGIATQGSEVEAAWTTSYIVSYSSDAVVWTLYEENAALGERTFSANTDQNTVEIRAFRKPFDAQYVRVNPKSWRGRAALRMELYGPAHAPTRKAAPDAVAGEWTVLMRFARQIAYFYCEIAPRDVEDRMVKACQAFQTAAKYLHVEEHLQVALRVKYGVQYIEDVPSEWQPPTAVAEALSRAEEAHAKLTRRVAFYFLETLKVRGGEEGANEQAPVLFLRASNASGIAAKWAYVEHDLCNKLWTKYGEFVPAATDIPDGWQPPSVADLRVSAAKAEDRIGDPFAEDDGSCTLTQVDDGEAPQCGDLDPASRVAWKAPDSVNVQLQMTLANIETAMLKLDVSKGHLRY